MVRHKGLPSCASTHSYSTLASDDGNPQWQVTFSRLSAAKVTVRLRDKAPLLGESAYDPREPYYAISERGSLE